MQAGDLATAATVGSGTDHSLVFWLGDGLLSEVVVSALEITDTEWHFVSAAYEKDAGTVRFTLDGRVDTASGLTVTVTPTTGPLLIGAHTGFGGVDSTFDGRVDEVRISGYAASLEQLLDRMGQIFNDGFDGGDTSAWSVAVP